MSLLEVNNFVMQKKILSIHEHYDFLDEEGNQLGQADGNIVQIPPKFVVADTHGMDLMHMQGKTISFRHEFTLYTPNGEELGTMKRKIAKLVGEEFWLEQNGREIMRIFGDFTEHDYKMQINGSVVATVHRRWATVRDQLQVSITDANIDHRLIIGAVIVIEHVEVSERQSSSG